MECLNWRQIALSTFGSFNSFRNNWRPITDHFLMIPTFHHNLYVLLKATVFLVSVTTICIVYVYMYWSHWERYSQYVCSLAYVYVSVWANKLMGLTKTQRKSHIVTIDLMSVEICIKHNKCVNGFHNTKGTSRPLPLSPSCAIWHHIFSLFCLLRHISLLGVYKSQHNPPCISQ